SDQVLSQPGLPLQPMNPAWKSSARSTVARAWIAVDQDPPELKRLCELIFGNSDIMGTVSGMASATPRMKAGVRRHRRSARSHRSLIDRSCLIGITGSELPGDVQFSWNSRIAEPATELVSDPEKPGPSAFINIKLSQEKTGSRVGI